MEKTYEICALFIDFLFLQFPLKNGSALPSEASSLFNSEQKTIKQLTVYGHETLIAHQCSLLGQLPRWAEAFSLSHPCKARGSWPWQWPCAENKIFHKQKKVLRDSWGAELAQSKRKRLHAGQVSRRTGHPFIIFFLRSQGINISQFFVFSQFLKILPFISHLF